ncbi:hypothetical protein UFOVP431_25 [uncultured Caudovirales phage]|uniref:Uncharacterized protein n=1 Tax=uncultured Caudovirales phage TaxID=2100421 RepID=A0A6J5MQH6_9CAUD|nr:hypothetical protein UFOVP431_25 [uncultured Caudovirales phage]
MMPYTLSADELEAKWGGCEDGHPTFTRSVHKACLLDGRTLELDYWKWVSSRSGYESYSSNTGWT